MMTAKDKKQLRNHANRSITHVLDKLGVSYSHRDTLIQAICPCQQHGGDRDNTSAFSWRSDIGYWMCWSHHCQEKFGNDIFGLIRSVLDVSFQDAFDWLTQVLTDADVDITIKAPEPVNRHLAGKLYVHEPLDETNLKWLSPRPRYLLNRGFSPDVLDQYQVGLWQRLGTYMHDRVVVPVRDHEGYLVGFTGRTIHSKEWHTEQGVDYNKWIHGRHYHRFPKKGELRTSSVLFNLFKAKQYIRPSRRLILLEGPLDGFKLEMAGIYNWAGTLSTSFGSVHRTLLVNLGITDLYVAYDNDPRKQPDKPTSSEKAWERMERIVGDLFNLHRVNLPLGRDPGDMEEQEILDIFKPISQC